MRDPTFAEILLEGDLALNERYLRPDPTLPVVQLTDVLRQLDAAQAAGRRAVLLVVDSYGGDAWAGFGLYHALRELSEAGVHVVAYVKSIAGSTAALDVLGADYVVLDPAAAIHPHGGAVAAPDNLATRSILGADALLAGAVYAAHTFGRQAELERWSSPEGEELRGDRALGAGFADFIGDREAARELADELAIGVEVYSRRRSTLAALPRPPALVDALLAARELGAEVRDCAENGGQVGLAVRGTLERLNPWVGLARPSDIERVVRHLRFGASVVFLFGKIPTGVKQLLGLATSAKELRRRHLVSGVRLFLRQGWAEVREQSPEFKFIDRQLDRDARELFASLESSFTEFGGLKREVMKYAAAPIMLCQKTVNAITWYAAREQALEEGHANPAAYADAVVSMTQTGGGAKDLAGVQRGGELRKLGTIFFSYRSVLYNQLTEKMPGKSGAEQVLARSAHFWWLVLLPVVVEQLLMNGVGDDEDDLEDVGKRLLLESALQPVSTLPWIGEVVQAAGSGRPMRQAPWVETLHRNLATAGKAVQGDDLTEADAKALAELVGMVFHLPTQALWNYAAYTDALLSGELEEPVQDLLFRNPSKWE